MAKDFRQAWPWCFGSSEGVFSLRNEKVPCVVQTPNFKWVYKQKGTFLALGLINPGATHVWLAYTGGR